MALDIFIILHKKLHLYKITHGKRIFIYEKECFLCYDSYIIIAGISVASLPFIYAHEASPVFYSDSNMTNVIAHKKYSIKLMKTVRHT